MDMPDTLLDVKPRACIHCSRAKAKCVWLSDDDDICQRCLKYSASCSKANSVSKKRRGKATHGSILEQKIDEILDGLARVREALPRPIRPTEPSAFPENCDSTTTQGPHQDQPSTASSSKLTRQSSSNEYISIAPGFEVSFSDANQVLEEYMVTMLPEFPFVPVPSTNSSAMLKRKPLLLKTILWVCRPPSLEASAAFESWFRQYIANQVVVLMKKDLEIVQAILVFLAWNDIYFYATAKDTALVQLAISIMDDLKMTRPQWKEGLAFESIVEDAAHMQNKLPSPPNQTREECRTLMGLYYLTSTFRSLLGKRYKLDYAAHIDGYCRQLQHAQEYPTDPLLVNLVGIRKIAMKVHDSFWEMMASPNNQPSGGVYSIAVDSIQNELETFMNQLPVDLKWNHLLRTHCASIRIRLFEPFKSGDASETPGPTHLRSSLICDCLQSTHELYDAFRLVPVVSFPSLTVVSILQIALAIIKASRLLLVEDQAWDLNTARTMHDLPGILQQLSKVFEDASRAGSPRSKMIVHGLPIFSEYAEAYRGIERAYLNRINTDAVISDPSLTDAINGDHGLDFWNQLSEFTNGIFP